METSSEVAVKNGGTELAAHEDMSWGHTTAASEDDVIIPKLLLMQKTSKFVDDESLDIGVGDIVRSTTKEVLAKKGESVEIIPLNMSKTWVNFTLESGQPKFIGIEERNKSNDGLPWDYEVDGIPHRRDATLNVYCLIKDDVDEYLAAKEKGEPAMLFPSLLSFSRTSARSGQVISSHFFLSSKMGVPAPMTMFKIQSTRRSNDNNSWYGWDVTKSERTPDVALGQCREWWKILQHSAHEQKVDHSDLGEAHDAETIDTSNVEF